MYQLAPHWGKLISIGDKLIL